MSSKKEIRKFTVYCQKCLAMVQLKIGVDKIKSEEKKTAHFQKLANNKKSLIFVLSS